MLQKLLDSFYCTITKLLGYPEDVRFKYLLTCTSKHENGSLFVEMILLHSFGAGILCVLQCIFYV